MAFFISALRTNPASICCAATSFVASGTVCSFPSASLYVPYHLLESNRTRFPSSVTSPWTARPRLFLNRTYRVPRRMKNSAPSGIGLVYGIRRRSGI
ncbi:hypothetical protein AYO44_14765 [Planctomycetaceae bacterium SCGC AG-212-F19]|nr:hypothetical protein AYO44_14765 [Planctomycetaceae bacterium SCGC AG-212-F19]